MQRSDQFVVIEIHSSLERISSQKIVVIPRRCRRWKGTLVISSARNIVVFKLLPKLVIEKITHRFDGNWQRWELGWATSY